MVQPLRRAKLGDIAGAAFLLVAFSIVPFVMLFTERSRVRAAALQTAYAVCLGLSWPVLLLGGVPLFYFWRKDRAVDRQYVSTATASQLGVVMAAAFSVALGCLLLLAAEIVGLVDLLRRGLEWIIVVNVIAILLLCWIVQLVTQTAFEVRDVRRSLKESAPLDVPPVGDAKSDIPNETQVDQTVV